MGVEVTTKKLSDIKKLQRWMFGYGTPETMAVIRILFGTLIFINLLMLLNVFEAFFTEKGFVPVAFAERWAEGVPRLTVLAGVTDSRVTMAVFIITMLGCIGTALGLFTRVSAAIMWLGLTSIHHRTPDLLHSGDTLMRAFSLYILVAPCGAVYSLDWLRKFKRTGDASVPEVSLWPHRLMAIQVAIVYFTTAWHKWGGTTWRDGTATWYTAQLHEFDRFPVPAFVDQQPFVAILTYGTLIVEIMLATTVFYKPLRKISLLLGIGLHLGIEYRFNIPLFAFLMIASYASFYEGYEWRAWVDKMKAKWMDKKQPGKEGHEPAIST